MAGRDVLEQRRQTRVEIEVDHQRRERRFAGAAAATRHRAHHGTDVEAVIADPERPFMALDHLVADNAINRQVVGVCTATPSGVAGRNDRIRN
jgi:hypothetical protein